MWEKRGLLSPASGVIGAETKLRAVAGASALRIKFHKDMQAQQEAGQSEADYWKARAEEKNAMFLQTNLAMNEQNAIFDQQEADDRLEANRLEREERAAFRDRFVSTLR